MVDPWFDPLHIELAYVVGMPIGGILVQLLLLDHPERLLRATVFATAALGAGLAAVEGQEPVDLSSSGRSPELYRYRAIFWIIGAPSSRPLRNIAIMVR